MDIDHEILKFSNMNRDIHIGHLLETDREGTGYCSLLALSKQGKKEEIIEKIIKANSAINFDSKDQISKIPTSDSSIAS